MPTQQGGGSNAAAAARYAQCVTLIDVGYSPTTRWSHMVRNSCPDTFDIRKTCPGERTEPSYITPGVGRDVAFTNCRNSGMPQVVVTGVR